MLAGCGPALAVADGRERVSVPPSRGLRRGSPFAASSTLTVAHRSETESEVKGICALKCQKIVTSLFANSTQSLACPSVTSTGKKQLHLGGDFVLIEIISGGLLWRSSD